MPVYLGGITGDEVYDSAQKRLQEDENNALGVGLGAFGFGAGEAPATTTAPVAVAAGGGGGQGAERGQGNAFGVGRGTMPMGAGVSRWATWAPAAPAQSVADAVKARMAGKGLSKDPQLPNAPGGAYTDSQYQAENASLEQQVNAAYADILQQTGFDVGGKHTPGSVEMAAARKERDYLTEMVNAANDVTSQMQQAGTIFSGYHAAQRAKAEQPMITGLGDLNVDTPNTLARLTENAGDLMRQFVAQRNALLAAAAWRQEQRLLAEQAAAAGQPAPPPTEPPPGYVGPQISGGTGTVNPPDSVYHENPGDNTDVWAWLAAQNAAQAQRKKKTTNPYGYVPMSPGYAGL